MSCFVRRCWILAFICCLAVICVAQESTKSLNNQDGKSENKKPVARRSQLGQIVTMVTFKDLKRLKIKPKDDNFEILHLSNTPSMKRDDKAARSKPMKKKKAKKTKKRWTKLRNRRMRRKLNLRKGKSGALKSIEGIIHKIKAQHKRGNGSKLSTEFLRNVILKANNKLWKTSPKKMTKKKVKQVKRGWKNLRNLRRLKLQKRKRKARINRFAKRRKNRRKNISKRRKKYLKSIRKKKRKNNKKKIKINKSKTQVNLGIDNVKEPIKILPKPTLPSDKTTDTNSKPQKSNTVDHMLLTGNTHAPKTMKVSNMANTISEHKKSSGNAKAEAIPKTKPAGEKVDMSRSKLTGEPDTNVIHANVIKKADKATESKVTADSNELSKQGSVTNLSNGETSNEIKSKIVKKIKKLQKKHKKGGKEKNLRSFKNSAERRRNRIKKRRMLRNKKRRNLRRKKMLRNRKKKRTQNKRKRRCNLPCKLKRAIRNKANKKTIARLKDLIRKNISNKKPNVVTTGKTA